MKLFVVVESPWGTTVTVVRAEDEAAARSYARAGNRSVTVTELSLEEEGVLWQFEEPGPDSR